MDQREYRRAIAVGFYRAVCPDRIGEIEFIDFNYPVRDVRIPKGTRLAGFKDPRVSPFRTTFFTVVGTPIEILAWSEKGREHPVAGGGWQYKIPHPERYVRYTTAFPQAPRPPADR